MELKDNDLIAYLYNLIERIENKSFQGILLFVNSEQKEGWFKAVKGNAEDRLALIDSSLMSMFNEPNQETRNWFFTQVYDRFKRFIPHQLGESGLV